jgi:hypothetical protein
MEFTEENKDTIKYHLKFFVDKLNYHREQTPNISINEVADMYIDDQIRMRTAMEEYYQHEREIAEENTLMLNEIRKTYGKTFHKYLMEIIEDSEGMSGLAEIVTEPVGKFQVEKYGRTIKGIWVEQWNTGMESDSWSGYVCVQLEPNKFFKFNFSM